MATTTTQRRRPGRPPKASRAAAAAAAVPPAGGWIHADRPLELSLRPYQPVPPHKPRRRRWRRGAATSRPGEDAARADAPSPPAEPPSRAAAPAPAPATGSALYDPTSPWGAGGILYDPVSPRWPVHAAPSLEAAPSPFLGHEEEEEEEESAAPPHSGTGPFLGPGLRRILESLRAMQAVEVPQLPPACEDTARPATQHAVAAASVPKVPRKRKAPPTGDRLPRLPPMVGRQADVRPVVNVARDEQYRRQMLAEIQARFVKTEEAGGDGWAEATTHGGVANRTVHRLLSVAQQPNVQAERGPVDAHFVTGDEARALLEAGSPGEPIVTDQAQAFRWQPCLRPIAELFRRMENLERQVCVQVPSRDCRGDSFEVRPLTQVRARFLAREGDEADDDDPWNVLDLRSPLPAAVLPQFLTGENCQLLPRLRDEVLNPRRAERDTAPRQQWNEWRDVLEWVLLAQGGHNTGPHTDSHGLGTWITVQEGLFGFGWLSRPTAAERAAWTADPAAFAGGRWCYAVLEPGQTVFFNSGTVHFVFRVRAAATLALGGHVLQWTGVERWLQTVAAQMQHPHITNEDMEWSAPQYVRVVARLVERRLAGQRVAEMGGEAAVRRLLVLLREFDEAYVRPRRAHKAKARKRRR